MTAALPDRLEHDAIAEALLELRFSSDEVAELVIGKLAGIPVWAGFRATRLPTADIPAFVKQQDPNLFIQPVIQLDDPRGGRLAKIGSSMVSFHRLQPYPGWTEFSEELRRTIEQVFNIIPSIRVHRIGLKYINVFTKESHQISSVNDLRLTVATGGEGITSPMNINILKNHDQDTTSLLRIASSEFVQIPQGNKIDALADIDLFTSKEHSSSKSDDVIQWIENAHRIMKDEFFRLIPEDKMKFLIGDKQ